ncbi:hypothetical protein UFOVP118_2 [uncultured Caudovirales phage]|uniref:Uncharacterized protein n=1 Tax=uncultured Caudovirales phage TaxID=2100421 RepID=A0A6J5L751_9CAUD|nr:hypothetical protein UFOVP118_2 [uncultured Caudovirales phage]
MNNKLLRVLIDSRHAQKTDEDQQDFKSWLWNGDGLKYYGIDDLPEHVFIDTFNYYWDMPDY